MSATKIIPGDTMVKIRPRKLKTQRPGAKLPSTFVKRPMSQKYIESRQKAEKALQLKAAGFSWARICEELGYAHESSAAMAVKRLLQRTAKLATEDWLQLHIERTETMFRRLEKGMIKGDPRSVEVAVKVLDRQSELLGLDYEDRKEAPDTGQHIEINILADPRDPDAQRFLAEINSRAGRVIEGEVVHGPLLPPAEGDQQQ